MSAPRAGAAFLLQEAVAGLRRELAEIELTGTRGGQCTRAVLAVILSVIVALWLRLDAPWWAAISAFVSLQATAPSSIARGMLRIAGTAAGAALAVLIMSKLAEDTVAISLVLFVASAVGVLGLQVSNHGYAWLLGAATVDMVLLSAIADPTSTLEVACSRTAEVTVGAMAAMLVSILLTPAAGINAAPAARPGWGDLLGAQWPATQHAVRAGIGVMLVPWVWYWLELPSLAQSAVTIAAVMAVQSVSGDEEADRRQVEARATHRIFGCFAGGIAGLAALSLSFESFLPWLTTLAAGVWLCAHVQTSQRGISYVGTQAAVVFITMMIQQWGPPTGLSAGIERFVGITGGLLVVTAVTVAMLSTASDHNAETSTN
ncbi:MAG: FUSC family protein [Bradyrhizobium sp.]|uniref:FUSC family protein n=1 Tax=Bradyrhizobium sp. TaxID=376 RepID=UPI002A2E0CDE|nr:FUSC family protein [Bradyrhizobium sp.]